MAAEHRNRSLARSLLDALSCLALCVVLLSAIGGCTGGNADSNQTVRGQVTSVDAGAATFSVQADNGREYRFKLTARSQGNLAEIKEHLDRKRPLAVTYRGTEEPYEVVSAD